jgi:hypothetical protein
VLALFFLLGLIADILSRTELEEEYLFVDVVSTYLRAIRAGAVNVRHGAVLLAHYGRLGPAFDACVKIVIDVLKEEGMMYGNADVVVTVVTQAMQEVSGAGSLDACFFDAHGFSSRLSTLFSMESYKAKIIASN